MFLFNRPWICLQGETEGGTPPDSEPAAEPQSEPAAEPQQQEPQQEPQQQEPFLSVDLGGERYNLTRDHATELLQDWYTVRTQMALEHQKGDGQKPEPPKPDKPMEPDFSKLAKTVDDLNKKIDEDRQMRLQEQQRLEGERILDHYRRSFTDDEHFGQLKKEEEALHSEIVAEALRLKAFHKGQMSHDTALQQVMERYKKYGDWERRRLVSGKVEASRSAGPGRGSGAPPPTQEPKSGFTADDYSSGKCDEEALRLLEELEANA